MSLQTIALPSGEEIPRLGQGTWEMGVRPEARSAEVAALRLGLDLGLTLIDTAEMYADGRSEEVVAEAISGCRTEVFLVSKVLPSNAGRRATVRACEDSLRRLRTDRLDLYLLHWRGGTPLAETLEAFQALQAAGKIRHWGVSNLDIEDMQELWSLSGGPAVATDQLLYNLSRRGIEADLLPWCRAQGLPVMAYSPVEQGRLLRRRELARIARDLGATPAQVALAWLLRQPGVVPIPKAADERHVRDNRAALDLALPAEAMAALEAAFPAPTGPVPLEML